MLSFAQHEEEQHLPKDTAVLDVVISDDSTKYEILNQLTSFYSQGDSGKVNVAIINVQQKEAQPKTVVTKETKEIKLFTWWRFFWTTLFFFGLYFLLHFFNRLLIKYNFLGKFQSGIKSIIKHSLLVFEAVALLILGGAFILINPIYHGILALVILTAGFNHVRNYFSGRIVQFDQSIEDGKRLKTVESQGVIFKMGRLGLKLRTQRGVQFVNYSNLISNGYTLLSGEEVGGFYELEIQPKDLETKKDYLTFLEDLFATAPYLDLRFRPQVEYINDETKTFLARVEVKEENHLQDLVKMIRERNFTCKVIL
jgi:hypothetical protein